jgi:hypothetical protein
MDDACWGHGAVPLGVRRWFDSFSEVFARAWNRRSRPRGLSDCRSGRPTRAFQTKSAGRSLCWTADPSVPGRMGTLALKSAERTLVGGNHAGDAQARDLQRGATARSHRAGWHLEGDAHWDRGDAAGLEHLEVCPERPAGMLGSVACVTHKAPRRFVPSCARTSSSVTLLEHAGSGRRRRR